jgi:ribonucleoside-triphosphate reductase
MMSKKELKVPVEVYSRVVGYFRPINQWNKGKQEEFRERKVYRVEQTPVYEYQRNI